jgi:GNAT superfamily N-acetyltransferase
VIVSAEYRNQGTGKMLLNQAQLLAEAKGGYKVALLTSSRKIEVHRFYQACGLVGNKAGLQIRFNS